MYKRTIWQDHVEGIQEGTDMNAANFNNLEAGTMEANALAAFNAEFSRYDHDITKNNEVIVLEANNTDPETGYTDHFYVAIPANATRNNVNYRVVIEVTHQENISDNLHVAIGGKQVNGFYVYCHNNMGLVEMKFYVSGGMI